jgi:hypothetical protein
MALAKGSQTALPALRWSTSQRFVLTQRTGACLSGWLVFLVCLVLLDEFPVRPTRQTR